MDNQFLKNVDDTLKEKVAELKAKKSHEELMGLQALIAQDYKDKLEEQMGLNAALFQDLKESIKSSLSELKIEPPHVTVQPTQVTVPEIKLPTINIPEIKIPEIKLPTINVPEIKIPPIVVPEPKVTVNVPETKFPKFPAIPKFPEFPKPKEYSWKDPLPVILTDLEGRPYTAGWAGGSGGGTKAISDIQQIAGYPISVNNGTADPGTLRITVASDSGVSVNVIGFTATIAAVPTNNAGLTYNSDNPLPITAASTLDVRQVSGAIWSTVGSYSYINISGNASTTVKGSPGLVHSLVINSRGTGSQVVLYDNLTDLITKIATIDTTLSTTAFIYDVNFLSGLVAVTTGGVSADLTVSYI